MQEARQASGTNGLATPLGGPSPRHRRRWLIRTLIVVAAIPLAVLAVYGWAALSTGRSSIARAMIWMDADVGDRFRFPARPIPAGEESSPLPAGAELDLSASEGSDMDEFLRGTDTLAFVVVHDDRLVYERYFEGSQRQTLQTSFSVAKSFQSTLVGIAIDEGAIGSIDDPVTDYVPELAERDPRFTHITLRNLLTMSSGLRYDEQSVPIPPWGDDIDTYYGTDLRSLALNETEIVGLPGTTWLYNNYNPLLIGLVLERATGMSVSEYMSTRLWQPLGAEFDATWSLDSEASGFEKMESGLNVAPVDYARFGSMLLHGGAWNGHRIVSQEWVRSATAIGASDRTAPYGYFWWVDAARPGRFYALGNLGQYIYVAPDTDTVIVRNGRDWGVDNDEWLAMFRDIADRLAGAS
jgi:CubicO group peptidase (beta-lactamase class C family)